MKICSKCKINKEFSNFSKNSGQKCGYNGHCKTCQKQFRADNKELLSKRQKEHRDNNKEYFKKASSKYYSENKEILKAKFKIYNKKNQVKHRIYKITRTYKITAEQYTQMFISQNYSCAICGIHQDQLKKGLVVDHNHITDEIRQLLCCGCNVAIGYLKEDPELFDKAKAYIIKHNKADLKLVNE